MIAKRAFLIALGIGLAALAGTLIVYPQLPAQMPVHWNARGDVDGYGAKEWAAFLMVGFAAFVLVLWKVLPSVSPRSFEVETFRDTYDFVMLLITALMAYMQGLILWAALAGSVDVGRAIMGGVFLLFALMGNVMGRLRRNFWMGVRTPWTLSDDGIWNATHRMAARLYAAAGIVGLAALAVGAPMQICLSVFIFIVLLPAAYSFVLFRRKQDPQASSVVPWTLGVLVLLAFSGGLYALMDMTMPREITVTPAMEATAIELVDNAAAGRYEEATKDFDDAMRTALPPSGLQSAWTSVRNERGEFVRRNGVRGQRLGGYDAVFVGCEFQKGRVNVKVVLDGSGRVTGLWFGP